MNDKYLIAVVRIPVRVTSDGNLTLMNEYSKITIEKMDEILTRTNDTIYGKVVDYMDKFDAIEEEEVLNEEKEKEEVLNEEKEEEEEEIKPILHNFSNIKKSKKPMNATFRARLKSQNFTKKVYSY